MKKLDKEIRDAKKGCKYEHRMLEKENRINTYTYTCCYWIEGNEIPRNYQALELEGRGTASNGVRNENMN